MKNKFCHIAFDHLALTITKNVNRKLRGEDLDILPKCEVEERAVQFYNQKKIGKYKPSSSKASACQVVSNKTIHKIAPMRKAATVKNVTKSKLNPVGKKVVIKKIMTKSVIKELVPEVLIKRLKIDKKIFYNYA